MINRRLIKISVLLLTFIVPLLFFLFLASGKVNFEKLPVLTTNVVALSSLDSESTTSFKNRISVLCFLGNDLSKMQQQVFNLNEVVYKKAAKYRKFQIVVVLPKGSEKEVKLLKTELSRMLDKDLEKWHFVYSAPLAINQLFTSLKTPIKLNADFAADEVFIIDEDISLRGRLDDEDTANGILFGYSMHSVATLKNKLLDDLEVVLYESKFAVKTDQP